MQLNVGSGEDMTAPRYGLRRFIVNMKEHKERHLEVQSEHGSQTEHVGEEGGERQKSRGQECGN